MGMYSIVYCTVRLEGQALAHSFLRPPAALCRNDRLNPGIPDGFHPGYCTVPSNRPHTATSRHGRRMTITVCVQVSLDLAPGRDSPVGELNRMIRRRDSETPGSCVQPGAALDRRSLRETSDTAVSGSLVNVAGLSASFKLFKTVSKPIRPFCTYGRLPRTWSFATGIY